MSRENIAVDFQTQIEAAGTGIFRRREKFRGLLMNIYFLFTEKNRPAPLAFAKAHT